MLWSNFHSWWAWRGIIINLTEKARSKNSIIKIVSRFPVTKVKSKMRKTCPCALAELSPSVWTPAFHEDVLGQRLTLDYWTSPRKAYPPLHWGNGSREEYLWIEKPPSFHLSHVHVTLSRTAALRRQTWKLH